MKWQEKLAVLKVAGYKPKKLRMKNGEMAYWFINPQGKYPSERVVCRDSDKRECIHRSFAQLIKANQ